MNANSNVTLASWKKEIFEMTLLPKFAATPAANKLIQRGHYLGQMN